MTAAPARAARGVTAAALAVLLASLCFGTTGTAQALGAPDAGAASVGSARILIGGAALGLIAWLTERRIRTRVTQTTALELAGGSRLPAWLVVVIGAAGVLAYQPTFFAGTTLSGVAVGTVVALGSAPVITGALDWLLRRRFPGGAWLLATGIATAGVAVLGGATGPAAAGPASAPWLGVLASLGAGASYALYTLAAKDLLDRGWSSGGSMGALFGVAAALSLPVLLTTDTAWLATASGLIAALWLGLVTTTVAYLLFGWGLARLSAPTVSTLTLAEPVTAALLGLLVLREQLSAQALLGLAIVAGGIVVLTAATGRGTRAARTAGVGREV